MSPVLLSLVLAVTPAPAPGFALWGPFPPDQVANMWGGWTVDQMLRAHFSGLHSSQLALELHRHGPLYVATPGDPPIVHLDPDTLQYDTLRGEHLEARYWLFEADPTDPGGYTAGRIPLSMIPAGRPVVKFTR